MLLIIIIYLALCVYIDWRVYKINTSFLKENYKDSGTDFLYLLESFGDRYLKGAFFLFYPLFLIWALCYNGLKVLGNDRSIFTGEKL